MPDDSDHPLDQLDDADREFVLRFVLASGSLKDVAAGYAVSYPTIRAKLDQLIERLERLRRGRPVSPLQELAARLVEKGELAPAAAKRLIAEHQKELKRLKENGNG